MVIFGLQDKTTACDLAVKCGLEMLQTLPDLNKFLSEKGYCSRREADRLIEKNVVFVNDVVATIGTKVQEGDKVVVNGKLIDNEVELVYIALHKPAGITCSTNPKIKKNIIDFINWICPCKNSCKT